MHTFGESISKVTSKMLENNESDWYVIYVMLLVF